MAAVAGASVQTSREPLVAPSWLQGRAQLVATANADAFQPYQAAVLVAEEVRAGSTRWCCQEFHSLVVGSPCSQEVEA